MNLQEREELLAKPYRERSWDERKALMHERSRIIQMRYDDRTEADRALIRKPLMRERQPMPAGIPPVYPKYDMAHGVGVSRTPFDAWWGNSPQYDTQIFFKRQDGMEWQWEFDGYVIFELDPQRIPFTPDGRPKLKLKLK